MTANLVGEAIAAAFAYLPDRDALVADAQRALSHDLEHFANDDLAGVVFALRARQVAKAIELGLIPASELARIRRQDGARHALFVAMNPQTPVS